MKNLNKLSFLEIKKFLHKKGFKILNKNDQKSDLLNYFKNFYYTAIFSFIIVSLPKTNYSTTLPYCITLSFSYSSL